MILFYLGQGSEQMSVQWKDVVIQRIRQGMTDEQIAISTPYSLFDIKSIRTMLKKSNPQCEHDYEVIEDDINVDELRFGDGDVRIDICGYVVFYCKRCLDIQRKVIE